MPITKEEDVFSINTTNRFGHEIAEHLNIIISESNILANQDKKSFSPVLLIYKDKYDIYPAFKKIIQEYEEQYPNFAKSNREDKVLVVLKHWASNVKSGTLYKEKKQKKQISKNQELKELIINFISNKIFNKTGNLSEVKTWINNHPKMVELKKLLIKIIKNGGLDDEKNELKNLINVFLAEKEISKKNINNNLFEKMKDIILKNHESVEIEDNEDDIYTIHAVKGETLRSVLLVDFGKKYLTKVLLHKYGLLKESDYQYTYRNLFYVAMSRVTHLFVFAMEENDFTSELREVLKQKNWKIIKIKTPVLV